MIPPTTPRQAFRPSTGTAQVGETLTASTSAISDTDGLTGPTYTYQWIRVDGGDTDISGATSSTYVPVAADVGKKVKVKVSFTDDDGNAEMRTSAAYPATGTIMAAPPACAAPTLTDRDQVLTGTLTVGSVTAGGGTAYGFVSGTGSTPFGNLSTTSFTVGTNPYTIRGATVQSGGTDDGQLSLVTTPEMSSADQTALTLHVCDADFALANASDTFSTLHIFRWSSSDLDWSSVTTRKLYLSVPTANPNTPATGVPTVTGTARVGETLTAVTTSIADAEGLPDSFRYQWVRVASGTDKDISGATASTYTLVGADEGNTVKVEVSFTDDAGNAEGPLTSVVTGSVASPLLSVADASGSEGGNITFTATLSAASAKTVTATWTASVASGDTATSGDLTGTLTGTLTFTPGTRTRTFTVATAEDTSDEDNETFTVTLSNLSNATLTGGTATGTITDDDGAAVLRIGDASAAEGSAITFTVTLAPASGRTVTVNYATSVATGDTATTGDFTASSGTLSFSPGDSEQTFTVATTGDTVDEPDETFTVTLSGPANATLADATATGTITDDDNPPRLSVADASAEEGNAVSFTATLSAASGQRVTATWTASVESGDTAASGDLTGTLSGTLTFAPGERTKTFTVGTREDTTDEDDETFTVTLSNLSNATLTGGTAIGTITDDDAQPTLGVSDESASEGGIASFTATLSAVSGKTVTVTWTASVESGDTAASSDLAATRSGSLSFAPGERTKTFTVGTTEDTIDEDNETFTVTLSGPSNATLSDATGRGTITDDDAAPTLSVADASAVEGNAVSFTATLSAASEKTVTATWTATRNTAESTDLTGALTGTLTFAAGDLTKTFTVGTREDTTDEDDETFTVALSGLSNATLTGGTAAGTIEDDDDPPTVGVADARAEEGENVGFTATLSAASEKTVTVVWTASAETGDTAEAGDLTGTLTGTLSFAPGDLTKSFTVRAREDNVDEIAEKTFTVTLSAPSNVTVPDTTAAGTIEDDDTTTLRVSGPASAVTEGGDAVFTVTLSTPNSRDIEAFYETRSSGSDPATHGEDYVPFGEGSEDPGSLSFAAGETSATVTVTTVDDQLDESQTERFELVLLTPRAGVSPNQVDLDFTQAGAEAATANVADNDPQPVVELVLDPASIGENGGSTQVTARMAGTVRSDRETTVTVKAVAVAPAVPGDFALSEGELRIAAGAADSTGTVTLTAVDNTTDAPDKSVTVSATVVNERGATAPAAKTLPIADDEDSPTVTLALSASSISEAGGTSVLTATLSHPSSEPTTVTVTPLAGSFTLAPANGRLTIEAGDTAGTGSVTLTAVDNRTDAPDNELTVTATAANLQGVYDDADGIELTIADEDAAPTPMLVLSTTPIGEAGGSATVRVTLTHPSSEATTVVVAAAGTVDRAAAFTLADATLTVPAGSEQSSGSATITATPDDTDAPDQVVTVGGTATNSQGIGGDPADVELTIADDDAAPTATLVLATNPIAEENGSTAVTASLSHPSSEATTVTVTAAAVSPAVPGDFSQSGSVLTIAAGDLESTGTVTVTAAPNFVDAVDKTVRVSATAANTQGKAGDPANVNLTIADDDERGFTWSPETMNIEEAAGLSYFMLALTSQPTADVTVTISDRGGDLSLLNPDNFDAGSSLALVFTPVNWNIGQRVGVTGNSDSDSRNESVDLRHAGAGGDYQGYSDTYRVTVADDEKVANKVILTVDPTGVEEGGGARQVTVTASLDGARRTQATAVTVTAGPGSAEASDFAVSPASFTLTIPAVGTDLNGSERRTVTLTPANDDIDEDDETVRFSGTTTATVENSTTVLTVDPADVTIADDDTRGVTLSTAAVSPGEGGSATWTVVLESAPTGPVTVTPAVTGDSDVTVTPATLTFTAVNWSRAQTVTVTAAEDDDAAGDTATVAHTVAGADYGANSVTAGRVAVTVTDNDERTLVLAPTPLRFDEGTSGTYTVALTAQPTGTVTVRPSVSDNPDVTVSPSSLRFTSTTWSTAQTVTVTARTDANGLEDRATVRHAISGADYGANGAVGPNLPVTVNDVATTDLIALSVAPASVPENGRRQTVRVTARVDGAARDTATVVSVQVIGKTASPTDFTASPSALTVTIAANRQEGSATFGLTGTADTLDEGAGETIEVRGTSPSGLDVEPAELTIADDDGRGLTLSRSALTVNEQGTGTYTLRLASQPTGPVMVTPAVKPGGSPDVRFTPARLDFTAVDWSRPQTVTVTAADDADGDNDEATLRHTASGGDYGGVEGGEVVVTVRDNDPASRSVQLAVDPSVVEESGGGATVTVTATLDGAARAATTDVALAVTGGTAEAVTDFAAVTGVTVTIPAQQLTGTATFRFSPVDDNLDEGLSETVVFGGAVTGLTVRPATLTIADDDGKGIELSGGSVTLTEEGSATYTVALATQPTGPVTVRVTVSGDRDVTVDPASLAFTADSWDTAQMVTVRAAHDDDAANDTAELRHAASGADYGGVRALPLAVQVTDNDTRGVTLSESTLTFREGASATWTVVLDTQPTGTVRVVPALATGSDADVTVTPSSLSFTASSWSRAQTVTVRAAHDLDKLADSATVEHTVSGADYGENSVTADDVRVTVTDDDVPSTAIALSVAPATVREGASATRLTVTAELDASPEAAATEVTLSLAGLTATSGTDFQAVDPVTLTLPAGQVRATARITLTPVRDAIDEGDGETVRIGAVNATSGSALLLNPSSLEVTIADDDTRGITLSRSALTVREEGSATWTVRLKSAPEGGDVTVTPTVTGNPDVTVTPASLTFTAADWSRAQTVTVTAADDADGDNETAVVEHRVSGADYGANAVTVPDLPVSVNDNDQTSRSVQLSVDPSVVEEDGGGATVTVTATLDGAARAAATDVALAVTGGTAEAADFAAVTGVTVTIPALQTEGTATFRFAPVDDNLDEGLSETVILGGTAAGLTVRPATLTIADDDGKGLELSQGPVTLTEEGSATYTVALATQPTGPVTVRVTVSGDRDVTVDPASLAFTAGDWDTAQTVTVRAAHDDDPLDDTAELRHAASGADYGGVRALPLAVAVTDNDTRAVTLSESTLSFDEGGSATYTVVLDTRPSGTVRVMPALATGSDADVTVTPSSLSFTATSWSRAQTVTVRAGEDADRVNDGATVEHAVSGADYGENGVTAASLPVTAIDRFSAPDAPTALTATAFGRNRIDLAWTAPPAEAGGRGIAGYHVEVSADRGNTWSVLAADTGTDSTAYQHGGLEFGTTRHYRVSTINRLGTSPASNVASATTDARPVVTFSHRTIPNENGDGSLSPVPRYEVTIAFSQPVIAAAGELRSQAVLTGGRYFSGLRPIPAANQLSQYYTEWKAEIVPSGPIEGGPVTTTLTIPENALRDRAGRLSRANTLRIESDLPNQDETPPQVIVRPGIQPGDAGWPFALGPFTVDVEFNEPVTGFVQSELRVANGRVTAWEPQEGGKVYRATVRPNTPSDETIEVTFNIPAGAARDAGGNASMEAAERTVPARPRPTVSVTGEAIAGGGGDREVTVTFSKPVTGFTENELIIQKPTYAENHAQSPIGAARVTTFTANENGMEYVFVVRPTRLGYVEMTVRANVANDAEGYPNLATHSYKVTNLTAIPQGTQRGLRAEPDPLVAAFRGAPANHDGTGAFALHLAFDGAITGDADDVRDAITVTNGGLTAIAQDKKESSQWNLTVTPSSTSDVTVEIAASAPCDEDGALCTADGRRLEASAETTIDGPAPVVTGPSIASARLVTGPGGNGTWDVGETVKGEIVFTAPVMVGGFPTLGLSLDGVRREASYALGSGTATVRFSYPVTRADAGATEARLIANGFDVTNGAIGGLQGQLAVLDFAVAPYVTAVAVLPDDSGDGQWSPGEKIEAQLTFSEPVAVTGGTPSVGVTAGGAAKTAPYASGAGTASLVFAYPVTKADGTVTRAALTADSLALNGAGLSAQATGLAAETGHGGAARTASTVRTPSPPVATVAPDAASMLSISDARAVEGVDASMTFTVTLAPASPGPVTANYATGGGSATEGQDYTGVYGRLRFAAGETSKTIEVAVLEDDHDEGEETFHLVLYQADGADIADGAGQGTIENTDHMPAAWLARFGRTVSDQVLDAVEARLRASRAAGVTVRLAGHTLGSARQAEADESDGKRAELEADARQKVLSDWLKGETRDGDRSRTLAGREVLMGSSFALAAKTGGGGFASVWGRMAQSRFAGSEETLRLDGEVTTGLLGADYAGGPWTGGVVLSHSRGDGDYRGKGSGRTEASLTVLTPWAGYAVSERVSLWGALGYGEGDVTLTPTDQTGQETDIAMTLAATGARGALLQGGGPKLDAVADARWVRTSSERVSSGEGNLEATSADVTRLRLGLEGAWALALGDGATLTPRLALGGRHDGGDAETGFGVDIGGGMALALPARGLTLSLQGRGLLSHAASGFRDSGFSGQIGWDSKPASEHGLTLSLRQTVGSSASGGGQALFSREVMENLGANDNGSARRLEAKLGYGFPAFGDRFTSTPELGLGLSNGQREISLGWRLNMAGGGSNALELRLEASRREHANDNADAVHGIGFRLTARW